MVSRIETLLVALHMYFIQSSKHQLELQKLAKLLDFKGSKILQNVKTKWINMLSPLRHVLSKYHTLLVASLKTHVLWHSWCLVLWFKKEGNHFGTTQIEKMSIKLCVVS